MWRWRPKAKKIYLFPLITFMIFKSKHVSFKKEMKITQHGLVKYVKDDSILKVFFANVALLF